MKDEIYEKLEDAIMQESRLVEKTKQHMYEYFNFEYDGLGINMEEADLLMGRVEKLCNKLVANIATRVDMSIDIMEIDCAFSKINMLLHTSNEINKGSGEVETIPHSIPLSLIIEDDGFLLEIQEIQHEESTLEENKEV